MIYISGPITLPNPMHNTHTAIQLASRLLRLGFTPFVPHLSVLWDTVIPEKYEDWIAYDLRVIDRCDLVVRLPGVSRGADIEMDYAKEKGIAVLYLSDQADIGACMIVDYFAKGRT